MNIRVAQLQDLHSIVEIYNQAILDGQKTADTEPVTFKCREKWFEDHNSDKYPILIAERNNKILGYLTISAYRPGRVALKHTAEVSYYIHFSYHRQKVATNLLKEVIELSPSLEIKTLFAILLDTNQGSINLLEKFGFKKWGHMPKVALFGKIEVGHFYYGLRVNK